MSREHPKFYSLLESLLQANPFGRKDRGVENRFVAPEAEFFAENPEELNARSLSLGKKPAGQLLRINSPIWQGGGVSIGEFVGNTIVVVMKTLFVVGVAALGAAFGFVLGSLFGEPAVGIVTGALTGVALGSYIVTG